MTRGRHAFLDVIVCMAAWELLRVCVCLSVFLLECGVEGMFVCLYVIFFFPFLKVTEYFLLRHFVHFGSQCLFVLSVRL